MFEPPPKKLKVDVLQTQNWTKMNTLMQTDVRFTGRMSQQVPDERSFQIRQIIITNPELIGTPFM